ncbi:hypothetical protein DFQ28_002267 [Apophysomyces sp. BC1034]|nr:hypothetical protein DFQ29_002236 [Apophysomyces sp. BC1021]KAG0190260.1 hypothetical protein DFQ28_002267 [Apophysomyces sp. BC1034]
MYRSKRALTHFQSLRDTNNTLSESMIPNTICTVPSDRQDLTTPAVVPAFDSRISSAGRSHSLTSPLQARQTAEVPPEQTHSQHFANEIISQQHNTCDCSLNKHHVTDIKAPVSAAPMNPTYSQDLQQCLLPLTNNYGNDVRNDALDESSQNICRKANQNRLCYNSDDKMGEDATGITSRGGEHASRVNPLNHNDSLVFQMGELVCNGTQTNVQQQKPSDFVFHRSPTETVGSRWLGFDFNPCRPCVKCTPQGVAMATVVEEEEKNTNVNESVILHEHSFGPYEK